MTIHSTHPFATDDDPVRRFRGRLGGSVSLWCAGDGATRAGLTVTSLLLAHGEPPRLLALLDPDADLTEELRETGTAAVSLLSWRDRMLAEVFAGLAPSPGGPFRAATFTDTAWGPRPADAAAWAGVRLESEREVGWSAEVTCVLEHAEVGEERHDAADDQPLAHRRGRYLRWPEPS
ncbi:flavin reductase family protein [Nocardioides bruguierae]|uniref:Flavin reductase family protein n=1 Tax=Nocardioides bruguierae TaxID=2945102 RepID=A0A9X2IG48_9ACTN|nr:flavin reductase [Nocardioides bruguierae]MCL8027026.1 flavin reductase family protein [Nocardioides bruguierae]MCM0621653.1 flavin reductase family protein [Nocardioides bruguierae]